MSALIRIALLLAFAAPAFADGTTRVLLADADPELQRAVKATLAPWKLDVVVESEAPADETHAQLRGTAQTARFVVWRDDGDLVVWDRDRGTAEHREAPEGPLDPASAAAAALTVKTLMRLPPPDQVAVAVEPQQPIAIVVAPTREEHSVELRAQGSIATRMTRIEKTNEFGTRGSLAAFVKPSAFPVRFGLAGELGSDTTVKNNGFTGTWSDWSVIALATWPLVGPRWEIEPYVGAGVLRSKLDGEIAVDIARHDRATIGVLRAGTFARLRVNRFSIGASLNFDASLGTPAYTRGRSGSKFFEVPPFALSIGFIAAADLSR